MLIFTFKMRNIFKFTGLALLMAWVLHAPAALAQHPADHWEVALEMGYLKKVKDNTPLNYVIVPTQVAWRSPAAFDIWRGANGARLTMRHRLAVVLETFVEGAEDYYLAFAGAPTFELWNAKQNTALFYEIGGGAGLLNSKNVPGGQGQDFTFNWFTQLGVRHQLNQRLALTAGAYFTHHSNLGMTDPNPGIDVLGLNLGIVWQLD
jgi:lipid A 3-O-deacylase